MKVINDSKTYGKLILFGEHSALYGFPASGTTLPFYLQMETINILPKNKSKDFLTIRRLFKNSEEEANKYNLFKKNHIIDIKIQSSIPQNSGFGSSAALCVAAAKIFLNESSGQYNRRVHLLANIMEKNFHGTPSGIDTGITSSKGLSAWIFNNLQKEYGIPKKKNIKLKGKLHIIFGALPRKQSTYKIITETKKNNKMGIIKELGHISEQFIIDSENYNSLNSGIETGRLAKKAHKALVKLELSIPEIDYILNIANKIGSTGGKISGAGRGGAFFICSENSENQNYILKHIVNKITEKNIKLTVPLTKLII